MPTVHSLRDRFRSLRVTTCKAAVRGVKKPLACSLQTSSLSLPGAGLIYKTSPHEEDICSWWKANGQKQKEHQTNCKSKKSTETLIKYSFFPFAEKGIKCICVIPQTFEVSDTQFRVIKSIVFLAQNGAIFRKF
ncbi:hypothetical protein TNIN_311001 [Trichonephila inaurata madagascariensis]|uniref:Uncharacterized protein n=1 Tax=Trichonephila inaurata madagascariensis TaxID=2747483 RepID=A0A8X6MC67_9ARAC|nr:hypothetical protein TNIN_311001 [Trichonephila inaurata madagascariensis]